MQVFIFAIYAKRMGDILVPLFETARGSQLPHSLLTGKIPVQMCRFDVCTPSSHGTVLNDVHPPTRTHTQHSLLENLIHGLWPNVAMI